VPPGETRQKIDQLIKEDPFYQEEIADYEVIEFRALKFHPSLASLVVGDLENSAGDGRTGR
jgi:hypothetical protein